MLIKFLNWVYKTGIAERDFIISNLQTVRKNYEAQINEMNRCDKILRQRVVEIQSQIDHLKAHRDDRIDVLQDRILELKETIKSLQKKKGAKNVKK